MTTVSLIEVLDRARSNGVADTSRRIVRRLYRALDSRMGIQSLNFPLDGQDITSSSGVKFSVSAPKDASKIGWLCTPASPGAGGHTTFFRMVRGMEERGHQCTILVYNRQDRAIERHREVIRKNWPDLTADIQQMPEQLNDFDVCVASSWETAHVLAARMPQESGPVPFYFVQDYEPYFHPRGSMYALAEDSYRFGFKLLALGPMVANTLRQEIGVDAEVVPFGSDLGAYSRTNTGTRSGVVFFAKPGAERRGYDMGRLALQEFHRLQPDQEIHIYGSRATGWGIPLTQHGMLTPAELNELYNRTIAGLALSFTNITLVAGELLAAGNIAVLNEHRFSRTVLTNPEAVWATATPTSLAAALSAVVSDPTVASRSERAAAHRGTSWSEAQDRLAELLTSRMVRSGSHKEEEPNRD
jgi:hypothetical protein